MKIFNGKSGSAYWGVYTLIWAFILTLLFIIFNQILKVYIYPSTEIITSGNTTSALTWISFWNITPYILIFIIGLFLYMKLTQRDTQGE